MWETLSSGPWERVLLGEGEGVKPEFSRKTSLAPSEAEGSPRAEAAPVPSREDLKCLPTCGQMVTGLSLGGGGEPPTGAALPGEQPTCTAAAGQGPGWGVPGRRDHSLEGLRPALNGE